MKLGLGLGLPGVAAMGGKQAYRVYAEAAFRLDARFNPDQATGAPSDLSSNGLTVTLSGGVTWTAGSHWEFNGSDGYLEVADNALLEVGATDSVSVLLVMNQHVNPANFGRWVSKRNSSAPFVGWELDNNATANTTYAVLSDGTNSPSRSGLSAYTQGATQLVGLIHDGAARTLATFSGSTVSASASTAAVTTSTNALPMRIGRSAAGATAGFQAFQLRALIIVRRVVTVAELAAVAADHGA